jgi:hypothetical protein
MHSLHWALDLKNIAQITSIFNSAKIKLNINFIDILLFLCYIYKVTQKEDKHIFVSSKDGGGKRQFTAGCS